MRRIFNLLLVASVAASFMFAGSAFAQDKLDELYGKHGGSKPKISGNAGYAFGFWTIENRGNVTSQDDLTGFVGMFEANMVFTGGNGPLDYRFRWRMRGRDRPEAFGDAGTLQADNRSSFGGGSSAGFNKFQTLRGHVRWSPTKNLKIRIAKVAVTAVTSTTENDPIQNLPCACFMADLFDKVQIDFQFTMGPHMLGFALAGETPGSMTTTGEKVGNPGSTGKTAGNENQSLTGFIKLNFGGFKVSAKVVSASGQPYDTSTNSNAGESFDSTGFTVHIAFPVGVGTAKFDVESATSDLANSDEESMLYTGFSISLGGLNIGVGVGTQELDLSSEETTQTNIAVHYRFPMGKGGWVGPEIALQTREKTTAAGVALEDEDITSIRWLHRIGF